MYRVLIVDDEMPALRFVRSIIEQFAKNFQVAGTAASGEQGLQFLQQHSVDLLITDISMHGMNGIELAQAARAMQPNIHIVIISGYGEFEYAQGAIQAGVDEYLLKPVSISKMTAILQSLEKKMDADSSDLAASVLPAADLKQLAYFISMSKYRMIKDYFLSLAAAWERDQVPQRQVWHMGRQLIHQTATVHQPVGNQLEETLTEFNEIIRCAGSYGDLMASLYTPLFDNGSVRDRKLSTQELYDYAVLYIEENYAQPLSMQSVCDEIGISQTYLSRLFRKYSDTTFNAFLTRCRMEAAMNLLRDKPDLLLRDVAACVGYDDSSYFTKVFHQYTGKTPSQFTSGE